MATIPIEVMVQDGPSPEPTPTPSDSGETNIVVPDTGVGTVENGSNGEGIGSVTNIILPAIILLLAVGAIVALLIRRQQGRKNNTNTDISRKEKLAATASGTIAILAATVLVGNLVIPATKAAASVEPGTAELDTVDKITITATREIDSDITIATVKNTSYATANLDFGYKVTASMIDGATTANLYLDGDETSEYYIAPVSGGTLADNTWGYTFEEPSEGTTYLPIPLVDAPATITKGNDMVEDEAVDIYYTIKVDSSLPAGTYTGEIEYTLTDNNFPSALTTMQGMTTEICENTFTPNAFKPDGVTMEDNVPTVMLKDIRDNKTYRVAKLADGKCWMTQNLDLQKEDLVVSLDGTNTDNPIESFELPNSQTSGSESWGSDETTINTAHVFDISATEETYRYCISWWGSCTEYGDDIPEKEFGNFYNWYSATAGTGTYSLTDGEVASGSICPTGWRLPNNNNANEATDYSYLLYKYDVLRNPDSDEYNSDKLANLYLAPLYFVPLGLYYYGPGINGIEINLWSSMAGSNLEAKQFSGSIFNAPRPWENFNKYTGQSVRCIVR